MPMYEFACRACGHRFETLVRTSAQRPACPKCGTDDLEKQYSTFGTFGGGSRGASAPVSYGGG